MRRGSGATKAKKSGGARHQSHLNEAQIKQMFAEYEDGGIMDMEGISRLGEDIGLDPTTDVRILVLCYKMQAKAPGQITEEEFIQGMHCLEVDSIEKLRGMLPRLDPGFMEHPSFREFYRFVFQFSREGTHRTIEKDIVIDLLPLVMSNRSIHLEPFLEFLRQCSTQRITLDQWNSFLEFSQSVSEDFEGYDEDGAWPLLIDEYVAYRRGDK